MLCILMSMSICWIIAKTIVNVPYHKLVSSSRVLIHIDHSVRSTFTLLSASTAHFG